MYTVLISVILSLSCFTISFGQKPTAPTALQGKRVTFVIPDTWVVQNQEDTAAGGRIQLLIPYPATDNTPHSANVAIIANVVQSGVSVKDLSDKVYGNQYPGLAVVNDIPDGKNWRTLVWTAKNGVSYVMLDRYGVVNNMAVEFLIGFPLLEKGDQKWIEKTVKDFNEVCSSLKIDGSNSTEAKVNLGKINSPNSERKP